MKKHILKGNMPQDGVFYNVAYEDGNIVFYVIDNFESKGEKVIIKTEDELIEKLLSTKYYNDAEFIEKIVGRFTKYSWCFVKALGIGGAGICMHYKERLKNINKQRGKCVDGDDKAIRGEMAKAAQMISTGVGRIISIFPSVDLTDREREVHVTQYAHRLAMAMAVAEMFKREEIDFGPTYSDAIDELTETITDDLKDNPYVKV